MSLFFNIKNLTVSKILLSTYFTTLSFNGHTHMTSSPTKKHFHKKTFSQKNYTIESHGSHVKSNYSNVITNAQFIKNIPTFFQQWVKLNTSMSSNLNQALNSPKPKLMLSFVNRTQCFNMTALFSRWVNTFQLFHTFFLYKSPIFIFSSPIFLDEVSSLNYFGSNFNYRLFRHVQPCFFFQEPSYGLNSLLIFTKLLKDRLDISVVTDIKAHDKTLFYLRSINSYSIGLVPVNYNQWLFSYPVPTTLDSFLSQYFFLK